MYRVSFKEEGSKGKDYDPISYYVHFNPSVNYYVHVLLIHLHHKPNMYLGQYIHMYTCVPGLQKLLLKSTYCVLCIV